MLKRIVKVVTVAVTIACLVVCLLPVHAFAVDPVSAIGLAGALDAYGMAYGVGTVYDVTSTSGISDSFNGLWDEFSEYQTNNNHDLPKVNGVSVNYGDYIEEWQSNYKALHGFSHSSGNFACWSIDEESAQIFDEFWNWLLTGPAEMTRVDNQFQFDSSQIGEYAVPINVISFGTWTGQPIPSFSSPSTSDLVSSGRFCFRNNRSNTSQNEDIYIGANTNSVYAFLYVSTNVMIQYVSLSSFSTYQLSYRYSDPNYVYNTVSTGTSSYNSTYQCHLVNYNTGKFIANISDINLPQFSSQADGINAVLDLIANGDSTAQTVGVKSYSDDGVVSLPNPYGQDYVPVPLEIVTSVPWDDTYNPEDDDNGVPVPWTPDSVPNVVDDIGDSIHADDYVIEADPQPDPDPETPPGEVFLPFLPVGLPSFNFSFSGIWHYVREWVSSLGAFFTTLFTIWSALPYAMVVPVYATAVVVIVLGVYKRFFM